MNQAKKDILDMLAAGDITATEAFERLSQLPPEPSSADAPPPPKQPETSQSNPPPWEAQNTHSSSVNAWIDEMIGGVVNGVQGALDGVGDLNIGQTIHDLISGTYGNYENTQTFESDPISQGIAQLEVVGKNAQVTVTGYEGKTINLTCHYNSRRPNALVDFIQDNGRYQLAYDDEEIRSMKVICHVPYVAIQNLTVETKNAPILVQHVHGEDTTIRTKNAFIEIQDVQAATLTVQTTNAKISAQAVQAQAITLTTTNATVKAKQVDAEQLTISTTNAAVKLAKLFHDVAPWEGIRTLTARTTNGKINLAPPPEVALKIEQGGKCTLSHMRSMVVDIRKDDSVELISPDYEYNNTKLHANLSTTRAKIKVQ